MSKKVRLNQKETNSTRTDSKKKDTSTFIPQGESFDNQLIIRNFPWTPKQQEFIDIALKKETNYVFCQAPAGVGKTLMSIYIGLKLLSEGKIKNIYFVRNPVESSSYGLGFLAGDLVAKFESYVLPMMDQLEQLLSPSQIKSLITGGYIQSIPLGHLKGRTFNCSLIIFDEAEDGSKIDMRLVMGRLGKFSKMLIIGDVDQSNVKNSAFQAICDTFNSPECVDHGIYYFAFNTNDIMRNTCIQFVLERFKFIK